MRNNFLLLFIITISVGCKTYPQPASGKLKIKGDLDNIFFTENHIGEQGRMNDNLHDKQVLLNAKIFDTASLHHPFNTCISFFIKDTLIIQLKSTFEDLADELTLKIVGKNTYAYLINGADSTLTPALSSHIVFKDKVSAKGQRVMAEIEIEFHNKKKQEVYYFSGPIDCEVQD